MKCNFFLLLSILLLPGCSTGGFFADNSSLEIHSMGLDRTVLRANCTTVVCTEGFANEGDIWMTDIPMDQIVAGDFQTGQIIHLQLLWKPVAGKTPLVSTSTNLTIMYYIISNGVVGIYEGGGFCWPSGDLDNGLSLFIEDANLSIKSRNANFIDLLSPASMSGRVTSVPDRTTARQIKNAAALFTP
jgi:hypothetical protein